MRIHVVGRGEVEHRLRVAKLVVHRVGGESAAESEENHRVLGEREGVDVAKALQMLSR